MKAALWFAVVSIFSAGFGAASGWIAGGYTAKTALDQAGTQRAEAQATFTEKDTAVIEFPALVRGRRINCTVYINTKRKASSVFC